jgi:hypothetical protein
MVCVSNLVLAGHQAVQPQCVCRQLLCPHVCQSRKSTPGISSCLQCLQPPSRCKLAAVLRRSFCFVLGACKHESLTDHRCLHSWRDPEGVVVKVLWSYVLQRCQHLAVSCFTCSGWHVFCPQECVTFVLVCVVGSAYVRVSCLVACLVLQYMPCCCGALWRRCATQAQDLGSSCSLKGMQQLVSASCPLLAAAVAVQACQQVLSLIRPVPRFFKEVGVCCKGLHCY